MQWMLVIVALCACQTPTPIFKQKFTSLEDCVLKLKEIPESAPVKAYCKPFSEA